jgi:tetratricopeptide (TPR) repeat protein
MVLGSQEMENKREDVLISRMNKNTLILVFITAFCLSMLSYGGVGKTLKAETYRSEGRYSEAIAEYDRLIKADVDKDADIGSYYFRSAEILMGVPAQYDQAVKRLQIVLQKYKNSSMYESAWILLAEAWLEKKDRRRAAEVLNGYLGEFKNRPKSQERKAYFLMADISQFLGSSKEALAWLARITQMGPGPYFKEALFLQADKTWSALKDREVSYDLVARYIALDGLSTDESRQARSLMNQIRWQYIGRPQGLQDDCVSAIAFDGDDIWFGLWLAGAARYTRSRNVMRLYTVRDGLASSYIRDIQVDPDEVWLATFEGISRYDRAKAVWQRYTQIPGVGSQRIKSVLVEPDSVWFGTLGYGIQRYNRADQTWEEFAGMPLNIVKVRKNPLTGDIAFASLNAGVVLRRGGVFVKIPIPGDSIGRNVKDVFFNGPQLFIATYRAGIWVYEPESGKMELFWQPDTYVSTMSIRAGKIFLGTLGDGLKIRDLATGTETAITVADGLQSSNILTIEFEKDYIWLGTVDNGVNILYAPELLGKIQ